MGSMSRTDMDSGFTTYPGTREIEDSIFKMKECIVSTAFSEVKNDKFLEWYDPSEDLHGCGNAFVIVDEKSVMYDTWSPPGKGKVIKTLEDVLEGRDLDYLALSHFESNHAGNTPTILDSHPETTLLVPAAGRHQELYLEEGWNVEFIEYGDSKSLGEYEVEFLKAPFVDQASTMFMFEAETRTLFTADWFGFQHMGTDCLKFADEMRRDVTLDQIRRFTGHALAWLRFADAERTDRIIEHIKERLNPAMIAPAHGQVIRRDVPKYLDLMKEVIQDISEQSEDYSIHSHHL